MKKIFKKIAKSLMLAFVMILSSVSIIACSDGTTANVGPQVSNISQINSSEEDITADEVTNSDETTSEEETTSAINGIFKFTRDFTFDDIHYTDLSKVLEFFETRDINGVYHEAEKYGFNEFAKNLTNYVNGETELSRAVSIENNQVTNLAYNDNSVYQYVNAENNFTFTEQNGKLETAENNPMLEYDAETKTLTIYYQFTYEADGKLVYTPLYVKTTLSHVEYSESITDAKEFIYLENSSKIVTTADTTDMTAYLNTLGVMFGVEEGVDINASVNETLASWTLKIDTNFEKILVVNDDLSFSISANIGDLFTFNGTLNATLTESSNDLTSGKLTVTFEVTLDAETTFIFNFIA